MPPAPRPESRLEGAIWAMFAADAYACGRQRSATTFVTRRAADGTVAAGDGGAVAGELTPAGDGALVLLRTLAAHGIDPGAYGRALVDRFGGDETAAALDPATRHLLARRAERPAWAAFDHGADDDHNVTPARLAPLVVYRLGHPALMVDVDVFTRVLQDNDRAVAYACTHARLLEHLLTGAVLDAALDRVVAALERRTPLGAELADHVERARAGRDRDVAGFTAECGRDGPLIEAFPAALQAALAHADDPTAAVRATCAAGGDGAGRAMLVASWLGARGGVEAVPAAWRETLRERATIAAALGPVLARRPSPRPRH